MERLTNVKVLVFRSTFQRDLGAHNIRTWLKFPKPCEQIQPYSSLGKKKQPSTYLVGVNSRRVLPFALQDNGVIL